MMIDERKKMKLSIVNSKTFDVVVPIDAIIVWLREGFFERSGLLGKSDSTVHCY